jgi:YbbR domain-containing protein
MPSKQVASKMRMNVLVCLTSQEAVQLSSPRGNYYQVLIDLEREDQKTKVIGASKPGNGLTAMLKPRDADADLPDLT